MYTEWVSGVTWVQVFLVHVHKVMAKWERPVQAQSLAPIELVRHAILAHYGNQFDWLKQSGAEPNCKALFELNWHLSNGHCLFAVVMTAVLEAAVIACLFAGSFSSVTAASVYNITQHYWWHTVGRCLDGSNKAPKSFPKDEWLNNSSNRSVANKCFLYGYSVNWTLIDNWWWVRMVYLGKVYK